MQFKSSLLYEGEV